MGCGLLNIEALAPTEAALVFQRCKVDQCLNAARIGREDQHTFAEIDRLDDAVGHEQDGRAGSAPDVQKLVVQTFAGDLVERTEGLVHEQDIRLALKRTRNGDALALAPGQLMRIAVGQMRQADQLDPVVGPRIDRSRDALLPHLQRQRDILPHGPPGQQRCVLEDEGDFAPPARLRGCPAEHRQPPVKRRKKVRHRTQQGRLAAAGRTENGQKFAPADAEVDAGQNAGRLDSAGIADSQILGFDGRCFRQIRSHAIFGRSPAVMSSISVV